MVCFSFYASCFVFWYVTATRIKLKSEIWAFNGLSLKKINRKMENLVVAYPCLSWHFFQSWWCPLYRGFTVVFYISFSTSNAAQIHFSFYWHFVKFYFPVESSWNFWSLLSFFVDFVLENFPLLDSSWFYGQVTKWGLKWLLV